MVIIKKRKIEEAEAVISFLMMTMMMKMEVVIEVDPEVKEGGKAVAEKNIQMMKRIAD